VTQLVKERPIHEPSSILADPTSNIARECEHDNNQEEKKLIIMLS
jgi:hypothetical protein